MITPFQHVMVPVRCEAIYAPTNGAMEAAPAFERLYSLLVSPTLVTMTEDKTMLQTTNALSHRYTQNSCVAVDNFKVMTLQQATNTKPERHAHMLLINNHPEECKHILSQLFHKQIENVGSR